MGRHQLRLLLFALRFPSGWHSYGTDPTTVRTVRYFVRVGVFEHSDCSRQFRLKFGLSAAIGDALDEVKS